MAEMTRDMYGAIGRVGNKTYYLRMGKTIVRTNTRPKNPKTEDQSLHRVLVKAVNKSYSKLKEICNHTFEDYDNAFECMNKFKRVNLMYLREHAIALMNSGQGLDGFYQFTPIQGEDGNGNWLRSNCQLVLNEAAFGPDLCSLAKAVAYSYKAPEIDMDSEFYLNNADGYRR